MQDAVQIRHVESPAIAHGLSRRALVDTGAGLQAGTDVARAESVPNRRGEHGSAVYRRLIVVAHRLRLPQWLAGSGIEGVQDVAVHGQQGAVMEAWLAGMWPQAACARPQETRKFRGSGPATARPRHRRRRARRLITNERHAAQGPKQGVPGHGRTGGSVVICALPQPGEESIAIGRSFPESHRLQSFHCRSPVNGTDTLQAKLENRQVRQKPPRQNIGGNSRIRSTAAHGGRDQGLKVRERAVGGLVQPPWFGCTASEHAGTSGSHSSCRQSLQRCRPGEGRGHGQGEMPAACAQIRPLLLQSSQE